MAELNPMPSRVATDVTRRSLLAASAGLVLPRWTWAESKSNLALCWKLEETGDSALERVSGTMDATSSRTGHAIWVGEGESRALRLDGYSVWVEQAAGELALSSGMVTMSARLALESYPVNDAAVVYIDTQTEGQMGGDAGNDRGGEPDTNVALTIDRLGFLNFLVQQGKTLSECKSASPVRKGRWIHIGASFGGSGVAMYLDGVQAGHGTSSPSRIRLSKTTAITLGKSPQCPVTAGVFPTGVLNGLLRDVRVFDGELSRSEIAAIAKESRPDGLPDLEINGPWCVDDPQRPVYHAMPPRAWTNEPHGLVYFRGQYHLFYQKNPNGPYWGHINWGHMTSPDLHHWTEMPVALWPEPGADAEGCWSGSAIVVDNKLALIYTGGDGNRASICLAMSQDGVTFEKHPGNPIIAQVPQGGGFPEFRDPFVWREGDTFYLIIGSAVKNTGGTALLYLSRDLVNWEYRKPLLVGDHETSGVFWEMPIFVKLGDQHALIVCEVPGRASYWVGTWKDETFIPRSLAPQRLELFNHLLSPTPFAGADGSVITMGIIPDQRSSKECWRAGWAHLYSLPRVIAADERGRLHQTIHKSVEDWFEPAIAETAIKLADGVMKPVEVSGVELNIKVMFKRMESRRVTIRMRSSNDGREHTDLHYEWETGRLVLDKSRASANQGENRGANRGEGRQIEEATYFPDVADRLELQLLLDHSVVEVFLDHRAAFADRIYPTLAESTGVAIGCDGGAAEAESMSVARLRQRA